MNVEQCIADQIRASISTKQAILSDKGLMRNIAAAAQMIVDAYEQGKKTLLAGNGGSAADAQHIAGEFVSKFYFDRPGIASIALTTDTSIITAIGNDYGYDKLFSRQIQAQGSAGDVFIGISANLVEALRMCGQKGIKTIGLTGFTGGEMDSMCDLCIKVPSGETPRIQESHILIGHIICCIVEEKLFGDLKPNQ